MQTSGLGKHNVIIKEKDKEIKGKKADVQKLILEKIALLRDLQQPKSIYGRTKQESKQASQG